MCIIVISITAYIISLKNLLTPYYASSTNYIGLSESSYHLLHK